MPSCMETRKKPGAFAKIQTSGFLTWSYYLEILRADDPLEIAFYANECENSKWSVRELHRQMQSMLFHRIALLIEHLRDFLLELGRSLARLVATFPVADMTCLQRDAH